MFEVLSRTTAWIDQTLKLRAYDATPSVRLYALTRVTRAALYEGAGA